MILRKIVASPIGSLPSILNIMFNRCKVMVGYSSNSRVHLFFFPNRTDYLSIKKSDTATALFIRAKNTVNRAKSIAKRRRPAIPPQKIILT